MGGLLEGNDNLIAHLTELRKTFLRILLIVFVGFLACWTFSSTIFNIVRAPILPYLPEGGLVFTAPMDKFLAHVKVSLIASVIITCPLWMYQIWLFVAPGLYANEKKMATGFLFSGTFLFLTGVSFVYFIVYPMAFNFLMAFGGETDKPMITISSYLSFFTTTTLVFGLAFEMPLIITILGMMGLVSADFLIAKRRYAIVMLAFLSAVFTPPDVISMFLMMVPMLLLYEISIFMVKIFGQKNPVASE